MNIDELLSEHQKWVESGGKEGKRADMRNAILQEANLHAVNLQGADMENAKLSVADLMGANLRLANMRGADLWMADLKDANLQGAELQGANLAEVTNLTRKQLDSAITDETTILPSGLR
jgi:uncharacterized protein YjbI with pentapeptide repeats